MTARAFVVLVPETVATVLSSAPSVRSAVYRLGTSETRLRKYCREKAELLPLLEEASRRGTARSAAARRLFRFG